eukprot:6669717-Alexandrium_andersonii.AAC.1
MRDVLIPRSESAEAGDPEASAQHAGGTALPSVPSVGEGRLAVRACGGRSLLPCGIVGPSQVQSIKCSERNCFNLRRGSLPALPPNS